MPNENKFYIGILFLMLFIALILIPVIFKFNRDKFNNNVVVPGEVVEEEFYNNSVSEYFNGNSSFDELGQYFIDDPFQETCSSAGGAVASNTVCIK